VEQLSRDNKALSKKLQNAVSKLEHLQMELDKLKGRKRAASAESEHERGDVVATLQNLKKMLHGDEPQKKHKGNGAATSGKDDGEGDDGQEERDDTEDGSRREESVPLSSDGEGWEGEELRESGDGDESDSVESDDANHSGPRNSDKPAPLPRSHSEPHPAPRVPITDSSSSSDSEPVCRRTLFETGTVSNYFPPPNPSGPNSPVHSRSPEGTISAPYDFPAGEEHDDIEQEQPQIKRQPVRTTRQQVLKFQAAQQKQAASRKDTQSRTSSTTKSSVGKRK